MRPFLAMVTIAALACGDSGTDPDDADGTESFESTLSPGGIVGEAVTSEASGSATFDLDSVPGNLTYTIRVQSMDNVIAAHIHAPATPTQNAAILLTLYDSPPTGTINGVLVSGTIVPGSPQLTTGHTLAGVLGYMRTDQAHVMVHSSEYPNGEIRGHVIPKP